MIQTVFIRVIIPDTNLVLKKDVKLQLTNVTPVKTFNVLSIYPLGRGSLLWTHTLRPFIAGPLH